MRKGLGLGLALFGRHASSGSCSSAALQPFASGRITVQWAQSRLLDWQAILVKEGGAQRQRTVQNRHVECVMHTNLREGLATGRQLCSQDVHTEGPGGRAHRMRTHGAVIAKAGVARRRWAAGKGAGAFRVKGRKFETTSSSSASPFSWWRISTLCTRCSCDARDTQYRCGRCLRRSTLVIVRC